MKKIIDIPVFIITAFFVIAAVYIVACSKPKQTEQITEETATAKAPAAKNCFGVCDITKSPDLRLRTNAQDQPQVDGVIDSSTYFWQTYHVRTHPVRLTQNYVTPASYTFRYGWDSLEVVNRVQLQCLVENIAPFGCSNDWVYQESQGYMGYNFNIFFDGLFEFETYEKGNGNNWKFLYSDYKKEFFPSVVPDLQYQFSDFCYYERAVQAKTGDFYFNPFRFPNHDGIYKLVLKFNPQIKGCRAVKEIDYTNNEETVILKIENGQVYIVK